ncbi:hypothetical protein [Caulobacter henricii]|uniref:Carboxypeptidase regulatory-like domain-containing protein n=1 Tax=Caulobacter henricii TaxID=69395 RepID=A0A0P0NZM1_9CAUL|nr:hypothetical protein [Caulobacter henricii]ALL13617.1 hypothetical protein AQ619_09785 [Caulobacter henricii]
MIGTPNLWAGILIAVAVVGGVGRQWLRHRAGPDGRRSRHWHLAGLVALQVASGLLLYLTLFPPFGGTPPGRLVIATQGAASLPRLSGDLLVTLPEAKPMSGAARVPDLATALRLYPTPGLLLIEGQGLTARDQIPLDRPAQFKPAPAPRGIVDLILPGPLPPGGPFTLQGQVGSLSAGVIELLDPAGALVDRAEVRAQERFSLAASARVSGHTLFDLRLKDRSGRLVERLEIPVVARTHQPPRVLVLAGSADPEIKYLRRWAQDAGLDLRAEIDLGGGTLMGDPPTPLTRSAFADIDLVIVDDRRWETLPPSARAALVQAIEDGLGLLLRSTGPLAATTRRDWSALGAAVSADDPEEAVSFAGSSLLPALALNRKGLIEGQKNAVPLIRDNSGKALADWRPRGQGRIGLWTVADSYALVLAGQGFQHNELWSQLFETLARPGEQQEPNLSGVAWSSERLALCPARRPLRVLDPDGRESRPQPAPATGPAACAAFWPRKAGWHQLADDKVITTFYVHATDAAPSLRQEGQRRATLDLVEASAQRATVKAPPVPGSPWGWAASLLVVLGLLWWLERKPAALAR